MMLPALFGPSILNKDLLLIGPLGLSLLPPETYLLDALFNFYPPGYSKLSK
jgi:hypothetical protein